VYKLYNYIGKGEFKVEIGKLVVRKELLKKNLILKNLKIQRQKKELKKKTRKFISLVKDSHRKECCGTFQ
jgi:hypothetical protein